MKEDVLLLGLDISTTSAKALLINTSGSVVRSASTPLTLSTPFPLWSEQHPEDWWNGIITSVQQALSDAGFTGDTVASIGLTGQMHGLVLLDENGHVLRPAILWNDQRTASQCDQIRKIIGKKELLQISGNDAVTGLTAPKILWVRENEPEIYAKVRQILLPKDYIRFRLTGDYSTDKAGAAGTLLFDLERRSWSDEILMKLQIPHEWLPPTHEGHEVTGSIGAEAAQKTGLMKGTPVVAGGSDQSAQAIGMGAVQPGVIALTLGTSGVVFASTNKPIIEPNGLLHAFCHAIPERWHLMGVMLSAAGSLQWYHDAIFPEMEFSNLLAEAEKIPAGSEGLIFLPYLSGERTPHPDPLARGAFIGLTIRHTRAHMTRAVLEGVAFGLRDGFELLKSTGIGEVQQVRVSGGGAKSSLWRSILSNVLDLELVTVTTTEGAAYGAALLAGVGIDIWPNVDDAVNATITLSDSSSPETKTVVEYEQYYQVYKQLYPTLKDLFPLLAETSESDGQ